MTPVKIGTKEYYSKPPVELLRRLNPILQMPPGVIILAPTLGGKYLYGQMGIE